MDALFGAASPTNFSALAIFVRGDFVVKLVLVGLLVASLWSWTVIIDKLFRFAALGKQAGEFEDEVNSGRAYLHLGLTAPQESLTKKPGQGDMFEE